MVMQAIPMPCFRLEPNPIKIICSIFDITLVLNTLIGRKFGTFNQNAFHSNYGLSDRCRFHPKMVERFFLLEACMLLAEARLQWHWTIDREMDHRCRNRRSSFLNIRQIPFKQKLLNALARFEIVNCVLSSCTR